MREFRVVDDEGNVYGEWESIVPACREADKLKCRLLVMDIKSKTVKQEFSQGDITCLANREFDNRTDNAVF